MPLRLSHALTWASWVVVSPIVLSGCPNDSGASTDAPGATSACDPFEAKPLPITLGKLIGAGKDAEGTLYVADHPSEGEDRVYVASDGVLVRQRVAGAGQVGGTFWLFSVTDHQPAFDLEVDGAYPGSARMGVLEVSGEKDSKTFDIGSMGTDLTIVPESEVKSLSLRNLPGDVVLEYTARLADERVLVVTRPRDDWHDEDVRLFLGPTDHVLERRVQNFSRGGFTLIDFDLDGRSAQAYFPDGFVSLDVPPNPTLTIGEQTQDMTALDDRPDDASYDCLAR